MKIPLYKKEGGRLLYRPKQNVLVQLVIHYHILMINNYSILECLKIKLF